jgi:hypothetical protein
MLAAPGFPSSASIKVCGFDSDPLSSVMLGERQLAKLCPQWFWAVLTASCVCANAAAPTVVITNLPAYGSTGNLGGVIVNAPPAACRVAVFISVPDCGWVTKPTCAQPLTQIQPDGSWSADITTGGSDPLATRIAALLVSTNYSQPCVQGAAVLPTNVFAQALASAVITGPTPARAGSDSRATTGG